MSETAVLSTALGVCFSLIAAIYALLVGRLKALEASQARHGERTGQLEAAIAVIQSQNARQERDVVSLQSENSKQEAMISALVERMKAREDAHAQHREDVRDTMGNLAASIARLEGKIDQMIRGKTPMPRGYDLGGQGGGQGGRPGG